MTAAARKRTACLVGLMLAAAPLQAATNWVTVASQSRLAFTATLAGGEFDGEFRRFAASIRFDPSDLAGSQFEVEIDTASADTGDAERDQMLAGTDFFAAGRWPGARFSAVQFVPLSDDRYEALGTLTIRDVSRDVRLPLRFRPAGDGKRAALDGEVGIRRLDYGVGQGEWQSTEWLGDEVRIRFTLTLERTATPP